MLKIFTLLNRLILMNSGAIRFDLYKGMVNKNDVFTAFPFSNSLPFVKGESLILHKNGIT